MAKDRNTMAKRQREVEKRQKAAEKRERKETRKRQRDYPSDSAAGSTSLLSEGEVRVLKMFRKYLMAPGQMLCLSGCDVESYKLDLDRLIGSGLLVSEEFKGSYSLTQSGYAAMRSQT